MNAMDATHATAAQTFVPVKEIKDGIVILKDGGYRGILLCSAVNFALKSAEEQQAITVGFQNFLNTIDFSIQIVVNSRRMDLRPYLAFLNEQATDQETELMRIQLREYLSFVSSFADQTNIMTKSFYIVVPYARAIDPTSKMLFDRATGQPQTVDPTVLFEEDRAQVEQRFSLIMTGLSGVGVRTTPLGTEEVIELLYRSFNPGELENPIRLGA
jgi:type IV secretory pathway VirB4 component